MKIKDLLHSESQWIKYDRARSSKGQAVPPESKKAVCWCLLGAIYKCYGDGTEGLRVANKVRNANVGIGPINPVNNITWWNDLPSRSFEEVRSLVVKLDI